VTEPTKPATAAEGRGLLGPDFFGGVDPAEVVRSMRDADAPLTAYRRKSRDFVPEPLPRPESRWAIGDALFVSQRAAQVQQCVTCGTVWDGDGPSVCPDCEDYTVVLPGASFDDRDEGDPDG